MRSQAPIHQSTKHKSPILITLTLFAHSYYTLFVTSPALEQHATVVIIATAILLPPLVIAPGRDGQEVV